jgi:pimeloyl-ACP methyl ester carboxylesterase
VIIGCIIAGFLLTVLAGEIAFRRLVTPKIQSIFENVPPFNVLPEAANPAARTFRISTADGLELQCSLLNENVENPPGLVLFLPELHGSHWMARRYCHALIENGFVVLGLDFRNQGESDSLPGYRPIHWMTEFEMSDVEAALEYIAEDNRLCSLPIVVFGVSRGGVAALLTGCRYPRIRGIIADSAFGTMAMIRFYVDRFVQHVIPNWIFMLLPDWHINITLRQSVQLSEAARGCRYVHLENEAAGLESANVLLISGARDSYVTPVIAARLRDIVGKPAELWIAPGAKHNMSRNIQPEEYDRRVLAHALRCVEAEGTFGTQSEPAMNRPQAASNRA